MQQIGTCVVYKQLGCYPAAKCTRCTWATTAIYEDDLAFKVAEHSQIHDQRTTTVTLRTTIDGVPISESVTSTHKAGSNQ